MIQKRPSLRPAIAMIELIFAIVVIGITLLSAPLVLNQTIKSSTVAMQQEAIAAASTHISLIMTHHWDENTSNAGNYGIVNTNGVNDLNATLRDTNSTYMTRTYNQAIAVDVNFTRATPFNDLGIENMDFERHDDIDDFHGQSHSLTLYAGESESLTNNRGEYLDTNIVMTSTISYGSETPTAATVYGNQPMRFNNPFTVVNNTTSIKLIQVTLSTDNNATEHDKSITLGAFSCNIGVPRPNTQGL